jgi:hypothetical protein
MAMMSNSHRPSLSFLEQTWNATRHELIYLNRALMEVALITPFALAFMPWARYWSPALVALCLLLLMLIPFNLSRWLTLLKIPLSRQQLILLTALVLTTGLAMHLLLYRDYAFFSSAWMVEFYSHLAQVGHPFWTRDLAIFILVVVMWWRGTALAGREANIQHAGLVFRVGGLILAPLLIVVTYFRLPWDVTPFIFLFILASLMAIALTRAEEIEVARSGQSVAMSPRWLATIFLAALLVILTTALATAVLSGRDVHEIINWLGPFALAASFLQTAVWITLITLAYPFIYVLEFIIANAIALFQALLHLLFARNTPAEEESGIIAGEPDSIFDLFELLDPSQPYISNRAVTLTLMIIVILLVGLALNRLFKPSPLRPQGERRLDSAAASSIAGTRPGLAQRVMQALGLWRQWQAAASVRRIYAQMGATAAAHGYPRAQAQTPYEYQALLQQLWPAGLPEIARITQAYVRVRYGEAPETAAELDEIKAAWAKLAQMEPQNLE